MNVQIEMKVKRKPVTFHADADFGRGEELTGVVVWIHPKKRFHVVEFNVRGGKLREAFPGTPGNEKENAESDRQRQGRNRYRNRLRDLI